MGIMQEHLAPATPTVSAPPPAQATALQLRLTAISYAAERSNLYRLEAADGAALPPFEAGAHIDLVLPNGLTRQYSLALSDQDGRHYTIGVKLDEASRGGSRYLHEQARVGASFSVSAPRNHFALDGGSGLAVLIGGGIGITPLWCMLATLRRQGRPWQLHYSVRTRAEALFAAELAQLAGAGEAVHLHVDDESAGYLDIGAIVAAADPDAGSHFYCCGPVPMLDAFKQACAALPPEQVHLEYFGAGPAVAAVAGAAFEVSLARSGRTVSVAAGSTILDALADAGVAVPSSCRQGVCGACETRVLEGLPDHRDLILSAAEQASNRSMMICCSGSLSERLVLDL